MVYCFILTLIKNINNSHGVYTNYTIQLLIKKNKIILNFVSNCMSIKSTTISYFVKSMRVHRPHFRTTGELVHDGLTISI